MRIRAAQADEAETLFAIQREASTAAYAHIFPPDRYPYPDDEIRAEWRARLADPVARTLVAERDGRVVGYVAFRRELLESLFVVPAEQRTGIGSALHDVAVEAQRELGAPRFRLWVLERNDAARRFYERRGWYADSRRREVPYPPHPTAIGYTLELPRA